MKISQIVVVSCCLITSQILCSCSNIYIPGIDDSSAITVTEESSNTDTSASAGLDILNRNQPKPLPQITPTRTITSSSPAVTDNESAATAGLDALGQNQAKPVTQVTAASYTTSSAATVTENKSSATAGLSSLTNSPATAVENKQQKVVSASSTAETETTNDCFEIKWLVPTSAVTVYHLRFGQSEKDMKGEVTLPIELLTKKNDPIMGPIYSYKILCGSTFSYIYIQIGSENKYGKSAFSEPTKLDR